MATKKSTAFDFFVGGQKEKSRFFDENIQKIRERRRVSLGSRCFAVEKTNWNADMTILSAAILLFLVMDPFGNTPVFLAILNKVEPSRRQRVILREMGIALAVLVSFLLAGPFLLQALQISQPSMRIAGGIILFLVAIEMIFGSPEEMFRARAGGEPLVVPLAIPLVAGPSAIATVMLLTGQEPERWAAWLLALFLAWLVSGAILLASARLDRFLGTRGLGALQSLMGLILTALAVEMFLQGVRAAFSLA